MIYESAQWADADQTTVIGWDSEGNSEWAPADYELFRQPEHGPVGFIASGGVIEDYVAPEPAPTILTPELFAMGQLKMADGFVSQVSISAALAGAFLFDTGEIWCFFVEEQDDTDYMVLAYDGNAVRAYVTDADKQPGYFVIRCTDFSGTPANPGTLNFEVKRVV